MIPKILHFTWVNERIPRKFQPFLERWRKSHPDWEIRLWTDASMRQMMAEDYPDYLALYDGYDRGIQRADAFRYFVLHRHGGVYADLDVEPLRRIDELAETSRMFVGLEPWDHVAGEHAVYTGLPYVLCNAFMGSEAGHAFWPYVFAHLVRCQSDQVMISTGPFFLSGAGLMAPKEVRPDLLPPELWSPLRHHKERLPATANPEMIEQARQRFTILRPEGGPFVSHLWEGTWHSNWRGAIYWGLRRAAGWGVWKARRRLRPNLVRDGELFTRPAQTFDDQDLILPDPLPRIHIAVPLKNAEHYLPLVKANIECFDYPAELLSVGFLISDSSDDTLGAAQRLKSRWVDRFAGVEIDQWDFGYSVEHELRSTPELQKQRRGILGACRTRMAQRAAELADYCLFLDADVCAVPPDAIKSMLSARRHVVMANCLKQNGRTFDKNAFVLARRPTFSYLYRAVSSDGTVYPSGRADHRYYVDDLKFLRIAPLDSVGGTLLLIDNEVIRAGVEFTAEPYKYHLETESFAIMARDRGFDVCGMPDVVIRHV